jgi:SAM-dependent methyltransferase
MSAWNTPGTADLYEAFCRQYSRYRQANEELIGHARLAQGMRVLDLAAGTGRTAQAALAELGEHGAVVCVEPSAEMREAGMRRLADARVEWREALPDVAALFDRVLCGAAIWQLTPLEETFRRLHALLGKGGALCFNIPALYLLEPDEPGGGEDPLLVSLPRRLLESRARSEPRQEFAPLSARGIHDWLVSAGFRAEGWSFRHRLSQEEYAQWLKIPVLTERMLPGLAAAERCRLIDDALNSVDRSSWKWERWKGWTAWKL